jgi:hypothetical protein
VRVEARRRRYAALAGVLRGGKEEMEGPLSAVAALPLRWQRCPSGGDGSDGISGHVNSIYCPDDPEPMKLHGYEPPDDFNGFAFTKRGHMQLWQARQSYPYFSGIKGYLPSEMILYY